MRCLCETQAAGEVFTSTAVAAGNAPRRRGRRNGAAAAGASRRAAPRWNSLCYLRAVRDEAQGGARRVAENTGPVLAADVGGTKTRVALFSADSGALLAETTAASASHDSLEALLADFLKAESSPSLQAVCVAAAGPVVDDAVNVTNLPWRVERRALVEVLATPRVRLANDLEATAFGMLHLPPDRLEVLQAGTREPAKGHVLVPAVGTGFGLAVLSWDGNAHHPLATESGHVGYAARTAREIALLRHLQREHGRVSLERVVSGPGLAAVYDFLRGESGDAEPPELAARMAAGDRSAEVTRAALSRQDPVCEQALELFVESFGAAVGDAVLAHLSLGGVMIGGGVAPKILPALRGARFLEAFLDKGRFRPLLESLRLAVCTEADTALQGAARLARRDAMAG